MTRPSKRAVMEALANNFVDPSWSYAEHGPDGLGWMHACVTWDGVVTHTEGRTVYECRRKLLAWMEGMR